MSNPAQPRRGEPNKKREKTDFTVALIVAGTVWITVPLIAIFLFSVQFAGNQIASIIAASLALGGASAAIGSGPCACCHGSRSHPTRAPFWTVPAAPVVLLAVVAAQGVARWRASNAVVHRDAAGNVAGGPLAHQLHRRQRRGHRGRSSGLRT